MKLLCFADTKLLLNTFMPTLITSGVPGNEIEYNSFISKADVHALLPIDVYFPFFFFFFFPDSLGDSFELCF